MKRAAWLLLVALGTIALALLAWYMRSVVIMLLAAILLGATMRPLGLRLQRIGVPRTLSVIFMALLIVIGVFVLIAVVGYSVAEEAPQLIRELQGKWLSLRDDWSEGALWQQTLAQNIGDPLSLDAMVAALDDINAAPAAQNTTNPIAQLQEQAIGAQSADATATPVATSAPTVATPASTGATPASTVATPASTVAGASADTVGNASALLRLIIEAAGGVAGLLGQLIILVFVSIYWTLEQEWFERLWTSLLPAHLRQPARVTWRSIETNVGNHVRSEIVQSLLAFVLAWLLFRLLGIPQPILLATVVALAWLIPLVGWLIALVVLVPIAVLNPLWVAIAAAAGLLAIFALLEFVVEPRLDTAREKLEIVGLIFAMIFLEFFGLLGLLLASPVAVALAACMRTWTVEVNEQRMVVKTNSVETLRARVDLLRAAVEERGEELPQRTLSLYERFEELLAEAEPSLQQNDAPALALPNLAAQNGEKVTGQ